MTQANFQEIIRRVYDEGNNQLRTTTGTGDSTVFIGTPTLYAVVNTSAPGVSNSIVTVANTPLSTQIVGNVTISDSKGFIGLTTTTLGSAPTLFAVVNTAAAGQASVVLDSSPNFIGVVTVANKDRTITGNLTLSDSKTYIGLTTTTVGNTPTVFLGTPTLYAVVNTSAPGITNSIVTVAGGSLYGNVTLDAGSLTGIIGNVTLSDAKNYIGLTTTTLGSGVGNIGFASITPVSAWPDPKTFIGLATVTLSDISAESNIGNVNVNNLWGNVTLSDAKTYIGLTTTTLGASPAFVGIVTIANASMPVTFSGNVTLDDGSLTGIVGNVTLSDAKTYIGLTTSTLGSGVGNIGFATVNVAGGSLTGNVTLDDGSLTGIVGNVTLSDSKTFIGLTTTTLGASPAFVGIVTIANSNARSIVGNITLSDPKTFIGLVTADIARAWTDPNTYIGLVTAVVSTTARTITGNLTLSDSKAYIGLNTVTVGIGTQKIGLVTLSASNANIGSVSVLGGVIAISSVAGNLTLSDSKGFIGLNTVVNGAGTQFIGLVTAGAINYGTNKTLVQFPVGLGNNSLATVVVPTNNQRIKVTQLILNSNVTTEIAIRSGVTYLTGNASLGVTLFPGGGFVMNGAPDSPVWIGLPSGSLNIEKRDSGGTVSKIAGHSIYFDEA